ncbi:S-methyl-5-thioribose-1-phosphate isomerase [bacterium]|nr:S-methyl-5-thioribose-1-phosphate isomerase [bacterium]
MKPVWWEDNYLCFIDQRKLPLKLVIEKTRDYRVVANAIKELAIRGAPAIGIASAYALVLAILQKEDLDEAVRVLRSTRPTAVNLFWAIDRMMSLPVKDFEVFLEEARSIEREDEEMNLDIATLGASLIPNNSVVLTHCNAGGLATSGYGTAIGVIRKAWEEGKVVEVLVDETRPLLQGARLTAWELQEAGIPYRIITDNSAGFMMELGKVSAIVVGADRIASNGDVANKIGTCSLAILANRFNIPFIVAAPTSSFDWSIKSGKDIPIEERREEEVLNFGEVRVAPLGAKAVNFAFDVTPGELITAIVCEVGILKPPFLTEVSTI